MTLTDRELDVLLTYARSGTIREAAADMELSQQTIKNTLLSVHRKLGVRSSIQALWKIIGDDHD